MDIPSHAALLHFPIRGGTALISQIVLVDSFCIVLRSISLVTHLLLSWEYAVYIFFLEILASFLQISRQKNNSPNGILLESESTFLWLLFFFSPKHSNAEKFPKNLLKVVIVLLFTLLLEKSSSSSRNKVQVNSFSLQEQTSINL